MGFGDYADAMEFRDLIKSMVRQEMDQARPTPTYARVYSIDTATRSCLVVMTGDVTPVKAVYGSIIPAYVDQTVRLEGPPGARYIADVLGDNSSDIGLSTVTGKVDVLRHNTRMQENIVGGGNRQVSTSGIAWTEPFYIISTGRNASLQAAAFYSLTMPTSGTVAGVGGAASRSFSATGISLGDWEALYMIIPTISNNATLTVNDLRVVSYQSDYTMPENAVLLAIRSGTTGKHVTWGDGDRMVAGDFTFPHYCEIILSATTGTYGANTDQYMAANWTAPKDTGGLFKASNVGGSGSGFARIIIPTSGRYELLMNAYLDLGAFTQRGAGFMTVNGRTATSNAIVSDHRGDVSGAYGRAGAHVLLNGETGRYFNAGDIIYWGFWSTSTFTVQKLGLGGTETKIICKYIGNP